MIAGHAALLVTCAVAAQQADPPPVDFAREVLPILSNKCFACHGPDTKRKNLVRLDSFAAATRDLGGYRAVDPEAPATSELLKRIHDETDPMPPEDSGKTLSDAERKILKAWVLGGGGYARHWAFVPPKKPPLPRNQQVQPVPAQDAAHPIDAFVGARLRAKGVSFAPEAAPTTLARRVAMVLTGLPPRPTMLEEFAAGSGDGRYAALVDALLDDPRFGEHQARYWLDAIRYGDTHGLHLDNRRGIYPYRDWVVRAFNENLPLDDFIVWQLAGDLLPDPTLSQRVATGFVRMNPSTSEGGAIPAEFHVKNSFDRTETLGTVMLGMTLTCARCHTHKYDPIEHREYYGLMAFLNNTRESPLDGNRYDYAPVTKAPRDQQGWAEWAAIEAQTEAVFRAVRAWPQAQESTLVAAAASRASIRFVDWRLRDHGAEDWSAVTKGLPGTLGRTRVGEGQHVTLAWTAHLPRAQRIWLQFSGGEGSRLWVDGQVFLTPLLTGVHGAAMAVDLPAGEHELRLRVQGRKGRPALRLEIRNAWNALHRARSWQALSRIDRLRVLADPAGPFRDQHLQRRAARLSRRATAAQLDFDTTLVAEERPDRRPTRALTRGEYDQPYGEPVPPAVPAVMGALPPDAPRNRLGLARWLVGRDHPLVARVLVNRLWQRVFGAGLVRTPEDFGRQGEQPTHPELLDWLAVELQDSGWDLKHMLRLMVQSRTFRQRSAARSDLSDPENRWLGRGPRFRLDAEMIRDVGLLASGLLDPVMGGAGVKPYQPDGMWLALAHPASNTKRYVRDRGEKLYRRSLYVYWKRTSPHPMMTLFDAPSRESSCVVRSRSTTPLQSLGLFNETQRLEMARKLGERLLREGADDARRVDRLFELLVCRAARPAEQRACQNLVQRLRTRYRQAPADAQTLLARSGDAPAAPGLDSVEVAAWSQLAVTVLASDAVLFVY